MSSTQLKAINVENWKAHLEEKQLVKETALKRHMNRDIMVLRQDRRDYLPEQPHKVYYSAMLAAGWLPINDMFGATYRWVHGETWGILDNALAYDYWRLTGRVVEG